jgi:segregation and condensation protein A
MSMYRVKLTEFEGPLDLLLFFIKRDELDIYNIPISRITKDFFEYLHLMATLDLEVAGEFIVMAATLMQIKVRMLLPRDEDAVDEEDPRAELVRRLIEYKRYKEMAQELDVRERKERGTYYRKFFSADTKIQLEEDEDPMLRDVSLFNLIAAFKSALDHMPKKVVHEVQLLSVTVDEQMSFVLDYIRVHGATTLISLVAHMTEKIQIIVTVMAVLELTKNKAISLTFVEGKDDFGIRPLNVTTPLSLARI